MTAAAKLKKLRSSCEASLVPSHPGRKNEDAAPGGPPAGHPSGCVNPENALSVADEGPCEARAPDFDRLAGLYRWMEYATFGNRLWRCRCAFLAHLGPCRKVLVLGDGDGRFTARMLDANRNIEVDAVDASPAMLGALARRAAGHGSRLQLHLADARRWQPASAGYDLAVTHFFLDCLTDAEISSLAAKVRGCTAPGALWAVSEFATPQSRFGRLVARPVVAALYAAFRLLTGLEARALPDHAAALRDSGFALKNRRAWLGGLLVSELWRRGG